GAGAAGESVSGACVLVASGIAAVLDRVAIHHCIAIGGNGGIGAMGTPGICLPPTPPAPPTCFAGGPGGYGGSGGAATGTAIAVNGSLSLLDSSVVDAHATGGNGGSGGSGGAGTPPGPPGNGGVGGAANGGAVAISSGASIDIINSTITESSGTGGNGGAGASSSGAVNGIGGYATGGLLYVDNGASLADLEFSTLANGSVAGGGGAQTGAVIANAVNAGSTLNVLSSIIVGAQGNTNLCYGSVTAATGSANLSEYTDNDVNNPSACNGFSVNATFAQTLKAIDASATPAYMPIWKSPAIDAAANCKDLASTTVTADQHGTARPQGNACDLGAIEADYIFVDGFGG
ncbi:MAG TPA: choice-of-anchor Q domain-containing protein, partial [Rudaea sp.]|nr:choice-of-anchor Q domain-containing protein [Rudaea sp.]